MDCRNFSFVSFAIIDVIEIIVIILLINALLVTLKLKDSAQRKGLFALYNLMLGHTKYNGVQRVYCNQFLQNLFTAVTDWTS
jgi:hypothetical protein